VKKKLTFKEWLARHVLYQYEDCFSGVELVVCNHSDKELLRSYGKNFQEAKKSLEAAYRWL
jgi:hypothetical protein